MEMDDNKGFYLPRSLNAQRNSKGVYSSAPEYPAACRRDEWRGDPLRSSLERRRVGYAAISLRYAEACCGELRCFQDLDCSLTLCPFFVT